MRKEITGGGVLVGTIFINHIPAAAAAAEEEKSNKTPPHTHNYEIHKRLHFISLLTYFDFHCCGHNIQEYILSLC